MKKIKSKLIKNYRVTGTVFFCSMLLARCGIDRPTSSTASAELPAAATSAQYSSVVSIGPNVAQQAKPDVNLVNSRPRIADGAALNPATNDLRSLKPARINSSPATSPW